MTPFRTLLLFYPRAFRRRYGPEMTEDFERLLERTRAERGAAGVVLLWARTAVDALLSGTTERLRGPNPREEEEGAMKRALFHLRHALSSLRRAPVYAAAFVVTLGLAVGVNSAVFSVVNGVLLRPLPFPDADRILYLKQPAAAVGVENRLFSFMEIDDYRAAATTVDEFVEFGDWEFTVLGEGPPHRAVGGLVTSNFFDVMGMRPSLGRLLGPEDDTRDAEPVMVLTDAYWARAFGRDPAVVGRVVDLEQILGPFVRTRVVGVLEPGLHYTGTRRPDFYVNYATNEHYQDAAMRDARDHRMTDVFARVAPGATLAAARGELETIAAELRRRYPEAYEAALGYGFEAVPWQEELTRRGRPTFLLLMGTVSVILVLAAANVTNLTLTRLIRKEGELATRAALGASRTDLRLHLTAENLLLGLAGGSLGVLLALASRDSLAAYAGRFTVRAQEVGVDWTVVGATLGGGLLLAVLLAWVPGLPVAPGPAGVGSPAGRATQGRVRRRLQRGLVVAQLAISFTLLTGAGLLVRSLIALGAVDPGFRTERILTLRTPTGPYGTVLPFQADPGWERALGEIRAFPGVRAAAIASWTPLSGSTPTAMTVRVEGRADGGDGSHMTAANHVSPGYFEMLGIRLVSGRFFDETDHAGSTEVVILNRAMARALFGEEDPVGRRVLLPSQVTTLLKGGPHEVVGVVADTREHGLHSEGVHTFYRPAARTAWGGAILVASEGDAGPIAEHVRDVIHRMDPQRAVDRVETLASLLDGELAPSRLNAVLVGSLAVLALLIAAVGVLGMLAFSVSQRVREFGIRMALGADEGRVLRSVLGEGAVLLAVALVLGGAGALVLGRLFSMLLFSVGPVDVPSLLTAAGILGGFALGASLLPALRATRIHPSEALRAE